MLPEKYAEKCVLIENAERGDKFKSLLLTLFSSKINSTLIIFLFGIILFSFRPSSQSFQFWSWFQFFQSRGYSDQNLCFNCLNLWATDDRRWFSSIFAHHISTFFYVQSWNLFTGGTYVCLCVCVCSKLQIYTKQT